MCLAVPGKITGIKPDADFNMTGNIGTVDLNGNRLDVSLRLVPDARVGDWVLVHAGFALQVLDEKEAAEIWEYLREMDIGIQPQGESS